MHPISQYGSSDLTKFDEECLYVGLVVQLCAHAYDAEEIAAGEFFEKVKIAKSYNQLEIYVDMFSQPCGYFIWANINEEVEQRLLRAKKELKEPANWSSGDRVWVVDLVATNSYLPFILADMRDRLLHDNKVLTYMSRRKGKLIAKRAYRKKELSIFNDQAIPRLSGLGWNFSEEQQQALQNLHKAMMPRLKQAETVGAVVECFVRNNQDSQLSIHKLFTSIITPILLGQYKLLHDETGDVIAFISWAYVSDKTLNDKIRTADQYHQSEWTEGDRLCFIEYIGGNDLGIKDEWGSAILEIINDEVEVYTHPLFLGMKEQGYICWDIHNFYNTLIKGKFNA